MKSINLTIFQEEVTRTLQGMYASLTALEICKVQLSTNLQPSMKVLDFYPNNFPYSYFNVDSKQYSVSFPNYHKKIYEQCIVSLITALENWCYEVLERFYILNFDKLSEEEAKLTFKEISGSSGFSYSS